MNHDDIMVILKAVHSGEPVSHLHSKLFVSRKTIWRWARQAVSSGYMTAVQLGYYNQYSLTEKGLAAVHNELAREHGPELLAFIRKITQQAQASGRDLNKIAEFKEALALIRKAEGNVKQ